MEAGRDSVGRHKTVEVARGRVGRVKAIGAARGRVGRVKAIGAAHGRLGRNATVEVMIRPLRPLRGPVGRSWPLRPL